MLRSVHIVLDSYMWEGSEVGVLAVLTVGQSPAKNKSMFHSYLGICFGSNSSKSMP